MRVLFWCSLNIDSLDSKMIIKFGSISMNDGAVSGCHLKVIALPEINEFGSLLCHLLGCVAFFSRRLPGSPRVSTILPRIQSKAPRGTGNLFGKKKSLIVGTDSNGS